MTTPAWLDDQSEFHRRIVRDAPPLLGKFNQAKVLDPVDIHAAVAVGRLLHESTPEILLAVALAVRGTRFGHVCVSLREPHKSIAVDWISRATLESLPWPPVGDWLAAVATSPLCGSGELERPLVLNGERLYLQRYWAYEQEVAHALRRRADSAPLPGDSYARLLTTLFDDDYQRLAAAMAATHRLTVIAGGAGTGKTSTVGRLLVALLAANQVTLETIALAAPTGKAAENLNTRLHRIPGELRKEATEAHRLGHVQVSADLRELADTAERLGDLKALTIHRLLGYSPARGQFTSGPDSPLPHDLVIIDEMSMVSLPLAARCLAATRPDARLVLVGDHGQLVSIEAGSVLGDIVGKDPEEPRDPTLSLSVATRDRLEPLARPLPRFDPGPKGFGDRVIPLIGQHRSQKKIHELADAVRNQRLADAMGLLASGQGGLTFHDTTDRSPLEIRELKDLLIGHARRLQDFGRAGNASEALKEIDKLAVLCAHRRGPAGTRVRDWVEYIEEKSGVRGRELPIWYPGRPVMVTSNNYQLGLFNGDIGVTIRSEGTLLVAFGPDKDKPQLVGPARLADTEPAHAVTIHKSQGSQFNHVVVVLPPEESPLLTRELLYTAITRAVLELTVVGTEEVMRKGIENHVTRASGLKDLLWRPQEADSSAQ